MEQRTQTLLDALKAGAQAGGELRLYRRGKLPGLFGQHTSFLAEIANQAVADGLLEVTRVETIGKTTIEWVRVTAKGMDFLLDAESPIRVLEGLREALTANQQALPTWAAETQARVEELTKQLAAEVIGMRRRLDHMAQQIDAALARLDADKRGAPTLVPWGPDVLNYLERRRQVGLGTRCPLADLFTSLKDQHATLSIKDFHHGLRQMQVADAIVLHPGVSATDTPGPEYALLDGPAVYYYVARAG